MTERVLEELRAKGEARVQRDPDQHLSLGFRQAVWAAFGPRAKPQIKPAGPHVRRIALAVAGVLHVLPFWKRRYPNNELPSVILKAVGELVVGKIGSGEAQGIFDEYWAELIHLSTEEPFAEIAAGFAAVQALSIAMYDEFFDPADIDLDRPDGDDPESFDSAFYAATAQAGGLPGDEESDPERRGQFWRWWLEEAVTPTLGADELKRL